MTCWNGVTAESLPQLPIPPSLPLSLSFFSLPSPSLLCGRFILPKQCLRPEPSEVDAGIIEKVLTLGVK